MAKWEKVEESPTVELRVNNGYCHSIYPFGKTFVLRNVVSDKLISKGDRLKIRTIVKQTSWEINKDNIIDWDEDVRPIYEMRNYERRIIRDHTQELKVISKVVSDMLSDNTYHIETLDCM